MDKNTLSQYGWVVIVIIILAIMIGLATPFGNFVKESVDNTIHSFGDKISVALDTENVSGPKLVAKEGTTGYVDNNRMYVYGVPEKSNPLDYFEATDSGYIEMSQGEAEEGITNGTGSLLTLYEDDTKAKAVAKYTLIIFGDTTGDAWISLTDASAIYSQEVHPDHLTDAQAFAADINADRNITEVDAEFIYTHIATLASIPANVWEGTELFRKDNTTGYVDYGSMLVYGVNENSNPLDYFKATNNGYIEMSQGNAQSGVINGTGSVLTLYADNTKSEIVAEYTLVIFGDVNGDGYIDITDANIVSQHANSISEITNDIAYFAADVNGDCEVDSVDVLAISDHVNGVSTLPVNPYT